MPLYDNMLFSNPWAYLYCFIASLADGVIIITLWLIGFLLFKKVNWFLQKRIQNILVLLFTGATLAWLIEFISIGIGLWTYLDIMPIIPLLDIGLTPFLQLIILPVICMNITAKKIMKKNND